MTFFHHLQCSRCGTVYPKANLINVCRNEECGLPLFARYDVTSPLPSTIPSGRENSMWRYCEMLPLEDENNRVSLGEGLTPLIHAERLGRHLGFTRLFIKDESVCPTGSFKARGLAMAVSRAKELGVSACAIPTAGNAGGAMSAYCARAGMQAFVFMPRDTPEVFRIECEYYGAHVTLVDGLITDCGAIVRRQAPKEGWFDMSTLKEPYRVEGKKTMGYEIAEQSGWEVPDVIIYPTGGGTGLIGMWKAFEEMEQLGWIGPKRPRMISVQAEGCAPIVKALAEGTEFAPLFPNAHTLASGLRVPKAIGDFLILKAIRESGGTAVAVSDEEIVVGVREMAAGEGIFAAPEGGATWAALKHLAHKGTVSPDEHIVLFNTGTAYKCIESIPH
jgi:threonine synthase